MLRAHLKKIAEDRKVQHFPKHETWFILKASNNVNIVDVYTVKYAMLDS